MESLFQRYRNVTVLLVVIFAQLILLAWQVKSDNDVPLVRVWAITAVTPVASAIEGARTGTTGFFSNYFALRNAREQSRELHTEVDRLKLENQFLKNELASAQRAEALAGFQAHTPSKMIGARVIGATTGMGSKSVLIDRGMAAGVKKGMAVVTPDGIVGKVLAVYPFASQVLAVTDPGFAAGVESQRNHTFGVLKGQGNGAARVDYVPDGQKVDAGEMFYTSGEDRVFPKGLPVGKVTSVAQGADFQNILVRPSGIESAPEEVLVIVDPVHQAIPEAPPAETPVYLAPPISGGNADPAAAAPEHATTADRLMEQYKKIGDAQKHTFGEGGPGTPPPNFNLKVPGVNAPAEPNGPQPVSRPLARRAVPGRSRRAPRLRNRRLRSLDPNSDDQAVMGYSGERILIDSAREVRRTRYPVWAFFVVPLIALLIQVYLPLFETLRFISNLELPLLVTIYFAVMRRSPVRGLFIGMALGLAQDSFSRYPIGMYGLCKTMVGYFAASIGIQFDVEHPVVRFFLCFVFYVFHQFMYWVLQRALLDQAVLFDIRSELILAAINAIIGVAIFHFLDKLRRHD